VLVEVEVVVMWVQDILDTLEDQLQVEIFQLQQDKLYSFPQVVVVEVVQAAVVLKVGVVVQAH